MRIYDGSGICFAFNIWSIDAAQAILEAAGECRQDVILQTSSNIYAQIAKKQLREFVSSYSEELDIHAWLNLDHCKDETMVRDAIDHGWDSVMLDLSMKPLQENIQAVNRIVSYAHDRIDPVCVEAEVGQVKGIEDDLQVRNGAIASTKEIDTFLASAKPDAIAVAFGNAHGIYQCKPELHYDLVEYTTQHYALPFVVHGASGLSEKALCRLVQIPGVRKINISTDVKQAFRTGLTKAEQRGLFTENGGQPIDVFKLVQQEIKEMACRKMRILDQGVENNE